MRTRNPSNLGAAVVTGQKSGRTSGSYGLRVRTNSVVARPVRDVLISVGAQIIDHDDGLVEIIIGGGTGSSGGGSGGDDSGGTGGGTGGVNSGGAAGTGVRRLNNSGTDLGPGAVVVEDQTADRAVTTTTTAGDTRIAGVVLEPIPAGGIGAVLFNGYTPEVVTTGTVTRGQYLQTSATAGAGQTTDTRVAGSFAVIDAAADVPDFVSDVEVTSSDTPVTSLAITLPTADAGREYLVALYRDPAVTTAVTLTGWTRIGATSGFWYYRKLSTGTDTATATWSTTSPAVAIALLLIDGVEIGAPVADFAYDSTTGAAAVSGLAATRQRYAIAGVQSNPSTPTDWTAIGSGVGQALGAGTPTNLAPAGTTTQDADNTENWSNLANITDGNILTSGAVGFWGVLTPYHHGVRVDLGAAASVSAIRVSAGDGGDDHPSAVEHSPDGTTWTTISGTWTPSGGDRVFTWSGGNITKRYWRAYWAGGPNQFHTGFTWYEFQITAAADQTAQGALFGKFIDHATTATSPFTGSTNQKDAIFALNLAAAVRPSALLYGPDLVHSGIPVTAPLILEDGTVAVLEDGSAAMGETTYV